MRGRIDLLTEKVKDLNTRLSRRSKIAILAAVILVLVVAAGGAYLLNKSGMTVLFTEISAEEGAEIVTKVNDMGIEAYYNNGTITVPKNEADALRAQLVLQGYPKNGLAYETFIENISMTTTDFEKNKYELYDLQNRIAATIRCFDGVSDAIVTIGIGNENRYVLSSDKEEPTASATVIMRPGESLSQEQVVGIQRLVSKSVTGLKEENVSVLNENGRDLSLQVSTEGTSSTTELKRTLEQDYENSLSAKIFNLLAPIYGEDNLRISVTCDIDVRKIIQERITYFPSTEDNKGVIDNENTSVSVVGDGTVATGVPGTDTNAQIPIYPEVTYDGNEIYYTNDRAYDYLVSQLKEQIQNEGGEVLNTTVSVVIGSNAISAQDMADLQSLVAVTAGILQEQIPQKVSILARPFQTDENAAPATSDQVLIQTLANYWYLLVIGGILLLLLLILLILLLRRARKKKKQKLAEEAELAALAAAEHSDEDEAEGVLPLNVETMKKTREMELKEQIGEFSEANPEIAASLIRTWLKGGDGA